MKLADGIIRTKLNPPKGRSGLVARQQLSERVLQGLHGRLTLIVAPAGFGKTTLVATSVAGCGMPVAWLSLDKDDNHPERFLAYLSVGLHSADTRIAVHACQLLSEGQTAQADVILTSIINELDAHETNLVMVLDDFQVINSQAIHEQVTFLLDHCPETLHLVISTRSDPLLSLARLRARGQMVELRSADLRFTPHEAAQFLNEVMGLHLDERSVALLEERTEGWIAGLQMAALSMRDRNDLPAFIKSFSGTNRYILDYLLEEVLVNQPLEIQNFLLRTSILERMTASLCDVVLDCETGAFSQGNSPRARPGSSTQRSSRSVLDDLERLNLFLVPLDDEKRWYRYHHLFKDLLRSRLANASLGQNVKSLHQRAAAWFEENGLLEEAIFHAMAAGDAPAAARLVEDAAENAWLNGQYASILAWTESLPVEIVQRRPWLCIWNAWSFTQMGMTKEMDGWIDSAEMAAGNEPTDAQALENEIAALRAFSVSFSQDYTRAIALAEVVLRNPPIKQRKAYDFIRCNLLHLLSSMYYATGQLAKARQACLETMELARHIRFILRYIHAVNKLILIEVASGHLGIADRLIEETHAFLRNRSLEHYFAAFQMYFRKIDLLIEKNRLDEAQRWVEWVLPQSKLFETPYLQVDFYNIQAFFFLKKQQYSEAQNALNSAAALASQSYIWEGLTWRTTSLQVKLWLQRGDFPLLDDWMQRQSQSAFDPMSSSNLARILAKAEILLAKDAYREAAALLTSLSNTAENEGRNGDLVEIRILGALSFKALGGNHRANEAIEAALALAEPEGSLRAFLDAGQPCRALIAQWLAHARENHLRKYAACVLAQFDLNSRSTSPSLTHISPNQSLIEPLSPRELEVLSLMALGKTNQEIADHLVVARGTVKAQAVSIFRKLDASNRTEAVARARQLGILP